MSFKKLGKALLDATPHRLLGLPSLVEGMIPAKVVHQPARAHNQPIVTPIAGSDSKAAANDVMRRKRVNSILSAPNTDAAPSLYTPLIG